MVLLLGGGLLWGVRKDMHNPYFPSLIIIVVVVVLFIVLFVDLIDGEIQDVRINKIDKTVSKDDIFLTVNETNYPLNTIEGIYIKRGAKAKYSTLSYRVGIQLASKGFFKHSKKPLMSFAKVEDALEAAHFIASFSGKEFIDRRSMFF